MIKIKICGLSRPPDIAAVNRARPEYIGFVFAKSARQVAPAQAEGLRKSLEPGIVPVGVFVNEAVEEIAALVKSGVINAVQLHGSEDNGYVARLKAVTGAVVIKAVPVTQAGDVQKLRDCPADYLLLDRPGGGTGTAFDWDLIGAADRPFFLAGGLHMGNLKAAIAAAKPFGVDISSGAETDGKKDGEKIRRLVRYVRSVEND